MGIEDFLPISEPTDTGRRMPGAPKLRREAGTSPVLDKQYRMGVVEAVKVPEGAPRRVEDLPAAFRRPTKPPGRESIVDKLRAALERIAKAFPEDAASLAQRVALAPAGQEQERLRGGLAALNCDRSKPRELRQMAHDALDGIYPEERVGSLEDLDARPAVDAFLVRRGMGGA